MPSKKSLSVFAFNYNVFIYGWLLSPWRKAAADDDDLLSLMDS
jgi:hypothetical protein